MKTYQIVLVICFVAILTPALAYRIRTWNNEKCEGTPAESFSFDSSKDNKCRLAVSSEDGVIVSSRYLLVESSCSKSKLMQFRYSNIRADSSCTTVGELISEPAPISGCLVTGDGESARYDCTSGAGLIVPSIFFVLVVLASAMIL